MKALKVFSVSHGGIRIRVRLLPTIADVHRAYNASPGRRARHGEIITAFFLETKAGKHVGTIFLPQDGRLQELVPHEVSHAVIQALGGVLPKDDEKYCTAVGILCARIFRNIGEVSC